MIDDGWLVLLLLLLLLVLLLLLLVVVVVVVMSLLLLFAFPLNDDVNILSMLTNQPSAAKFF